MILVMITLMITSFIPTAYGADDDVKCPRISITIVNELITTQEK